MVVDAPGASSIGGVDANPALNASALRPDTDAPLIVMAGSPAPPTLVSVTVLVVVDPVFVAGNATLAGENPSWLGLLPVWSSWMPLFVALSTACVTLTVMVGCSPGLASGKVLY